MAKRIIAVVLIFFAASGAWGALGILTELRTQTSSSELAGAVGELWGTPHVQTAPEVYALVPQAKAPADAAPADLSKTNTGRTQPSAEGSAAAAPATTLVRVPVALGSSDIRAGFNLDYRKKGLLWFSTYGVDFGGNWEVRNPFEVARDFTIVFRFPTPQAIYDNFSLTVDGREAATRTGSDGSLEAPLTLAPGEATTFAVGYRSRGLDTWTYEFGRDVTQVRDFALTIDTDFKDINFPAGSIAPTTKQETPGGWRLVWRHANLISGYEVGLEMPHRLNPGPLAAKVSFFAPVSLLFFFFVIFVLGVLRGVNLHPMHYFFLAAAFFAFDLLFAYLVDHLDVNLAFAIAAITSVGLVVSYLRLVVGNRFAFVEAGLAQLVYLVLFSYTHFLKGFTGLVVTVGAVLTLFVLMQVTAKVDWDKVFGGKGVSA